MKRFLTVMLAIAIMATMAMSAKEKLTTSNDTYRRNSLCTYFLSEMYQKVERHEIIDSIARFLNEYTISDKFDEHTVGNRFVKVRNIEPTEEDLLVIDPKRNKKKSGFMKFLNAFNKAANDANVNMGGPDLMAESKVQDVRSFLTAHPEVLSATTDDEYKSNTIKTAAKLYRYLQDNKIANHLIAKWFNAKTNAIGGSHYDLSLIRERGRYDAQELEVMRALESNRKWAILEDAGMDLISHTFVSFTEFEIIDHRSYIERQNQIEQWKKSLDKDKPKGPSLFGSKFDSELSKLGKAADQTLFGGNYKQIAAESEKRREDEAAGFYITSTTYLFQLDWDEEDLENFINNYWEADVSKLLNSDEFKIKYLGFERNVVNTTQSTYSFKQGLKNVFSNVRNDLKYGEQQAARMREEQTRQDREEKNRLLTRQSLLRSVDQTYAALQKKYEAFKVKTALVDVEKDNITAFIGMKEGITDKSKFEVMEKVFNEKKGTFSYKKVATLKVDKKRIWDNRYTLVEEQSKNKEKVDRTYFKGDEKKLAPGMLIRQVK